MTVFPLPLLDDSGLQEAMFPPRARETRVLDFPSVYNSLTLNSQAPDVESISRASGARLDPRIT